MIGKGSHEVAGVGSMVAATFFFSIMGACVKTLGSELPFMQIAFFRALINAILILPFMLYQKQYLFGNNRKIIFTRSLAGVFSLCCGFYVLTKMHLGDAAILNQTSVLFTALLSPLVLHEKRSPEVIGLTVLGFIGAACVIKPNLELVNMAGVLGLAAGLSSSVAMMSIRHLHKTEASMTIIFNFSLYCIIFTALASGANFIWPSQSAWWSLVTLGVSGTFGQVFLTRAYRLSRASIVSPYTFGGVVFSILWGYVFWSEVPDAYSWIGILLIALAGIGIVKHSF